eukprot:CAMPEP_0206318756 /NCGR_PEP_ID=MMETSP0106_2-20121207/17374_1 /ASSEMBLY_ACC=CAM_ASM_000206 /TAXON_ID=81532 /ORGANISM="Acanthoeca-like sp., Strain 10tr" /LENGTH=69 /DNA_ID=CAMNT_0053750507 /DNA_START=23 /DNA_END=229 /DNA_ORIENTATION=+
MSATGGLLQQSLPRKSCGDSKSAVIARLKAARVEAASSDGIGKQSTAAPNDGTGTETKQKGKAKTMMML